MRRLPVSASMTAISEGYGGKHLVSEYSADKRLNQRDFERSVWGEVNKLSDTGRRCAHLLTEGYTPTEMALLDGGRANTAAKRVHDIRRALKASLAEVAVEFGIAC